MNRLISILQIEHNLTTARLKQLYHILSKKTHPDLTRGSDALFLKLQREYEEALAILGREKDDIGVHSSRIPSEIQNPREAVLRYLYIYALKFFGRDAEKVLWKLIQASKDYSPALQNLLRSYYEVFFKTFHDWHRQARIYYTHNLFIASVKQLFYYYSLNIPLHKRLLFVYFEELKKRSQRLNNEQQKILLDLEEWLRREADKDKIKVF